MKSANEQFEYMAELFYKDTGFMAPGKDAPAGFYTEKEREEGREKWKEWAEEFYSKAFELHKLHSVKGELSASEALYGFVGWLTSREEVTPKLSSKHEASVAAILVDDFCQANNLSNPRDGWHKKLNHPQVNK